MLKFFKNILQYVTDYPACLGPEGCQIGDFSGIWVARPKIYKNTRK
jgi:hypothetical protein